MLHSHSHSNFQFLSNTLKTCLSLLCVYFLMISPDVIAEPSQEERKLFNLLNAYRVSHGLPEIALSASLTLVAQTHVRDLSDNLPEGQCNMHSWSASGQWSACCYTPDHAQSRCMWNKPRELTGYKGHGYEITFGGADGYQANADAALEGWINSSAHQAVMLNKAVWQGRQWRAVGVGIYKGYAAVWFGSDADPDS